MSEALTLEELGLATGSGFSVGRGRRPQLKVLGTRPLTEEDLMEAATKPVEGTPGIKALRQSHHTLAKLLAQGTKQQDAAVITGISTSRISILKADPSFAELLSYYTAMEEEGWKNARADMRERLTGLGFDSIETLAARLEEDPDGFSNDALMKLVELTTDRIGHGKTSSQNVKVTHALDDATLARIRGGGEAAPTERELSQEDRQTLISFVHSATGVYSEAQEAEGE